MFVTAPFSRVNTCSSSVSVRFIFNLQRKINRVKYTHTFTRLFTALILLNVDTLVLLALVVM